MREDKKEKRKGRGEREEKGRERGMEEGREGWRKGCPGTLSFPASTLPITGQIQLFPETTKLCLSSVFLPSDFYENNIQL